MKKLIIALIGALLLCASCAEPMVVTDNQGVTHVAKPYGWADKKENYNPDFEYDLCGGNIIWSIITIESAIIPIWLTGWDLYEPVAYIGDNPKE